MELKIIVTGSKFFNDRAFVYRELDRYIDFLFEPGKRLMIVNGGSKGVDSLAQQYATDNGIDMKSIYVNFNEYENKTEAFAARNKNIVDEAHVLVAFYSGYEDKDTKYIIDTACREGLETHIIPIKVEFKKDNKDKNLKGKDYKHDKQKGRKH